MPRISFETSTLEPPMLQFTIRADGAPGPFVGSWQAPFYRAPLVYSFELRTDGGGAVTGVINAGAQAHRIFDGKIDGVTINFRVKSPDGERTITFTGILAGDTIRFRRDVEVRPGGNPGGAALFGADGVRTFVATRVK